MPLVSLSTKIVHACADSVTSHTSPTSPNAKCRCISNPDIYQPASKQ